MLQIIGYDEKDGHRDLVSFIRALEAGIAGWERADVDLEVKTYEFLRNLGGKSRSALYCSFPVWCGDPDTPAGR